MYLTGAKTPTGKHATGAASTALAPYVMFPSSLKTRLSLVALPSHRTYWRPTQGSMFTFPGTGKKKMLFSPMETENSQTVKIALLSFTGDTSVVKVDGHHPDRLVRGHPIEQFQVSPPLEIVGEYLRWHAD